MSTKTIVDLGGIFFLFLTEAVVLQILGGAYSDGFSGMPDEAAHFVTSLMVRDFLASGDLWHPWAYAQTYYLHYPKVAFGHWPPVLYGALGTWMLLFGTSRVAVMQFFSVVIAILGCTIYFSGKALIGRAGGVFAGLLYVALPLAQELNNRVMTEHLVTVLILLSTLQFAKFVRTERSKAVFVFGGVATLAILSRGSAWALGLVPILVISLTRRFDLLQRARLWFSAVPVLAVCGSWYVLTHGMSEGAWVGDSSNTLFFIQALTKFPGMIISSLGFVLLLPALLGIVVHVLWRWRDRSVDPTWASLAALVIATFALHCVIPASIESRYMLTIMPSLLLFSATGIMWFSKHIPFVTYTPVFGYCMLLIFAAGFGFETFKVAQQNRNRGYETVALKLKQYYPVTPQVYLIASDPRGEGGMVTAVALNDKRPENIVLRASKVLVREDWLGRKTVNRFSTVEEIADLLNRIPVNFIVLDSTIPSAERREYHERVREVVTGDTETWEAVGEYPLVRRNREYKDGLHVYVRRSLRLQTATSPTVDFNLICDLIFRNTRSEVP